MLKKNAQELLINELRVPIVWDVPLTNSTNTNVSISHAV